MHRSVRFLKKNVIHIPNYSTLIQTICLLYQHRQHLENLQAHGDDIP